MKILSLGLDNSILNKTSALAARAVEYGNLVEKYTVVVPAERGEEISLSDRVKIYGVGGANKFIKLINLWRQAKILLKNETYGIITVQDQYYLAWLGLRLSKKYKTGLEIQIHGWEKCRGLRKAIANYVLPRAGAVRCVSQRLKQELVREFNVAENKITVVPIFAEVRSKKLPVSPTASRGGEVRSEKKDGRFIFLTVSRLVPVKNIGMQIEAMAEVVKKYPDAELLIIGDGPERKNYELRITNYELNNKIKLLGWQEDVGNYYAQADAFLLTSDYEGWGLAVIEVASAGLPIIMTDVGCAGEVIINNESGLVIPIGDRQKLIEAMLKIIADENLRKKLRVNAKAAVSRLPNREQTLGLYKKSWEVARLRRKL